jgi:DNA repair protein RadC
LNNSNKIIHRFQLSKGGITGTIVDLRLIFKILFEQNATALILVHNHPSGALYPSEADKNLTQKMKTAAQQLDFALLDHLIVTERAYFSFADEGIL